MSHDGILRSTLAHGRGGSGVTSILIGPGALTAAADLAASFLADRTVFLISSRPLLELHGHRLGRLCGLARRAEVLEIPDGEAAKSAAVLDGLWRRMALSGGKRDSRVLGFGGGSVGDLAGFAAGCFLRGLEFAQLPTTLLAQVDAAIGGKTGIDLPEGKNLVGLFHHPQLVISDTDVLATLPRAELRSGLVEAIKMAALLDLDLLARIERDLTALLGGETGPLGPVVAAAAAAKVAVVERDPAEEGDRRLLNFGHTLGHAIEATLGFSGLRHGEAVAYGLLFALRLSRTRGLPEEESRRLRTLLSRLDLPPLPPLDRDLLLAAVGRDKKALESGLAWVLAARLGEGRIEHVPPAEIRTELGTFLANPWSE
ncbi:MAG TPA: 3-dehydroquinate synthase family protein [Thermoanaerobaculia bacterium]|jgi:3-dehydroquinate synthase|nr:3-dehydroquinate synthase family protein [Thermoanaerobaculia bacterium]